MRFKKGSVVDIVLMPPVITAIVLGLIFLRILAAIMGIGSDLQFEKKSIAINSALLVEALHDARGNVEYFYDTYNNFNYDFQDGKVIVYKDKKDEGDRGLYEFAVDGASGRLRFVPKTLEIKDGFDNLVFVKQGNYVFVDSPVVNKNFKTDMRLLECTQEDTKKISGVVLDPGDGWSQRLEDEGDPNPGLKGFTNVKLNLVESEINRILAAKLLGTNPSWFAGKQEHSRSLSEDSKVVVEDKVNKVRQKGNTIISIHAGSDVDKNFNPAIAYINGESNNIKASRKLACLILNALSTELPEITDLVVVPVSVRQADMFEKDNPVRVLVDDKIGVQLVIGNIQIEEDNIFKNKLDAIAKAVYYGIKEYKKE